MTDTDDTDDLLIPQDFFVIESEDSEHGGSSSRYFSVVDSLIEKVDTLKKRIKSIESRETLLSTSLETTLDRSYNMQKPEHKLNRSDNLFPVKSAQCTPQKPYNKFGLNSLPASPNSYRFNGGRIPSNDKQANISLSPKVSQHNVQTVPIRDAEMSNEIDKFLSKVKTIQRFNTSRNLETDLNSSTEVQELLEDIDRKRQFIDSKRKDLDNHVHKNNFKCGDYKETISDNARGEKNLFSTKGPSFRSVQARKKLDFAADIDVYPTSDSSLDSSQHTTSHQKVNKDYLHFDPLHCQAAGILNRHKQLLGETDEKINEKVRNKKERNPKSTSTISDNLGLLSLGDIWRINSQLPELTQSQLIHKYQEEKLRRKHCEDLIQELQTRNLELQQKLSVAVTVDDSKNAAIQQFQEALEKIMARMEKLNKEKQVWESEVTQLKDKHAAEMQAAQEKISQQQSEASKALNVVQGNQEKVYTLEKKCLELQEYIIDIDKRLKDVQDDYELEVNKNKQLVDELNKRNLEVTENKNTLQQAMVEVSQSRRTIELCQSELADMKNENTKLESMLREEREEMSGLRDQKNLLLNQIEDYKRKQCAMKEDLIKNKGQLETIKLELNNFYQGQLEILVQNKLKEFQNQLDKSEATFKDEIKRRELEIAKTAAYHIQQIKDKFSLEIELLEKKHREESNLHKIQQERLKEQLRQLQAELNGLQAKRVSVVKQLQKMMEAQWTEALRIIQNGKSPGFADDTFSTIDQLNSLKVRSYNNLEEMLTENENEQVVRRSDPFVDNHLSQVKTSEQVTRDNFPLLDDNPLSRRNQTNKQYSEKEIQKYVNLLLYRFQNENQEVSKHDADDPTKVAQAPEYSNKSSKAKEKSSLKRPWK